MTKTKLTEQQKKDYTSLTDYIQYVYIQNGYSKDSIPWKIITAQIKNIMDNNKDWSYAQVKYCLRFMYEIEQVNLFDEQSNGSVLALLPFYFDKAKEFCLKQKSIIESVKNFDFTDEVKIIHKSDKKRYWKDIDIGGL